MASNLTQHPLKCEAVVRAWMAEHGMPGTPQKPAGERPEPEEEYWPCPRHLDMKDGNPLHASLKVNPAKPAWMCGPCGAGGNPWELAAFLLGKGWKWESLSKADQKEVTAWLRERGLLPENAKPSRKAGKQSYAILREHVYHDNDGDPVARRTRHDAPPEEKGERFRWWHLENGQWRPGFRDVNSLPLYIGVPAPGDKDAFLRCLERLAHSSEVTLCEGEHDADAGATLGLAAVSSGGTSSLEILRRNTWDFRDKDVVIVAHPGPKELEFAEKAAATLHSGATRVRIIKPSEFWPGNVKDLADIVEGMSAGGYGAETVLTAYASARDKAAEWKPATGAELLDATYNYIRKFAKVSEAQARALTLWVAHTFISKGWGHTSYVHIYSAERGEGKSTVVDVLRALLGVPTVLIRPSLAALYSDVTENPGQPQLIDEIDKMFTGRNEHDSEIYAYPNAGFQVGRTVARVNFVGRKRVTERFETFCPKVLAGRYEETLDDATRDRSIGIRMEKASWADHVRRWVEKFHLAEGQEIGAKLRVWCESIAEKAWSTDVWCTKVVGQRVIDIWEPQLAIAEVASAENTDSDWMEWAKSALIELSTGSRAEHDSRGVKLLKDIRAVRDARPPSESIFGSDLAAALAGMREEWAEYGRAQKPITQNQIARLLARYEIKSVQVWIGGKNLHGYHWTQFEKAWETYLSRDTGPSGCASASLADSSVSESAPTPLENQGVGGIPSVLAPVADPTKKGKEDSIEWFRLSELRAMRRGQRKRSTVPRIVLFDTDPATSTPGASLPRAIVNGHETAMRDLAGAERRPADLSHTERAVGGVGGIEFRGKGK
jgi:hypothetical protein